MISHLREQWPWNPGMLRPFKLWSAFLGIVVAAVLYPVWGLHALWWMLLPVSAFLGGVICANVGQRVAQLKRELSAQPGEVAESLMVIGNLQAPGVVLLTDSTLLLAPIMGERVSISLDEIRSLRAGSWLPGKYVLGKRVFTFSTPVRRRLAFAVTETVARSWTARLKSSGL